MRLNEQVKNFKLLIRLNELISSSSEFIIHINKEELIFFSANNYLVLYIKNIIFFSRTYSSFDLLLNLKN